MNNYPAEGFAYYPDFISLEEENLLLKKVKRLNWQKIIMYKQTAKRRVVHFGMDYSYSNRKIQPTRSAPPFLQPFIQRAASLIKVNPEELAEILITEYPIGAQIGWHRDSPVFDQIIGLSLLNSCQIKFRLKNDQVNESFSANLEPRSAYLLSGTLRELWEHSISPVKSPRYSITLRTLKNPR
ncbi:MAG: alpha-ketoglutarate-dependent dioxygenase AlkB [Tatlockia sp.]|nr:alpha-ketoglutarate-dependent dioxygenase AlkB [Tatlockia sp.]